MSSALGTSDEIAANFPVGWTVVCGAIAFFHRASAMACWRWGM